MLSIKRREIINIKSYLLILFVTIVSFVLISVKTSGATWKTEAVDDGSGGLREYFGEYTSIAIDSSNNVHISYLDVISIDLKYATNATGSWVITTVDSSGDIVGGVGWWTSIALNSSNKVHISYTDLAYPRLLKYATNVSGSWVTSFVCGSVGDYTSIAIDSSNNVHISYKDTTNRDLKYATTQVVYPVTDIKANGSDEPVTTTENLSVTVALGHGSRSGENADWWVATGTPFGWYYFDVDTMNWVYAGVSYTDLSPTYQ